MVGIFGCFFSSFSNAEAGLLDKIKANRKAKNEQIARSKTPKKASPRPQVRSSYNDAHGDAYINHALHAGDNGRVVGYDNQHGYHHRHYFGVVAAVEFTSFDDIEDQFQIDWTALRNKA